MSIIGSVTNAGTVKPSKFVTAADIGPAGFPYAQGSRPGENNANHVAVAIVLVGVVALAAGLINVKVSAGK